MEGQAVTRLVERAIAIDTDKEIWHALHGGIRLRTVT